MEAAGPTTVSAVKSDQVIVRLPYVPSGPVRIGTVIKHNDDVYLVQWDDGATEEVHLGDYERVVTRGSLDHRALAAPEELRRQFDADPKTVFAQALREGAAAMTYKNLKELLVGHGLDAGKVKSAWPSTKNALAAAGRITTSSKGSATKYAWSGQETETAAATSEPPSDLNAVEPDDAEPKAPASLDDDATAGAQAEAIAAAPSASSIHPEAAAVQPPTHEKAATAPEPAVEPSLEDLLAAAADDLGREPAITVQRQMAAAAVVRRCIETDALLTPALAVLLVDVVIALASHEESQVGQAAAHALGDLATILPKLDTNAREAIDVDRLAAAASHLPLTTDGSRVQLLAAVATTWPQRISDEAWWRGVSFDELAAASRGALGAVASRPGVAERIIKPRIIREVSGAGTYSRLVALLAAPREFVALLPADAVADAFRRVAATDGVVAGWVRVLSEGGEVAALQQSLEQVRGQLEAEQDRARQAELRNEELTSRYEQLKQMMRDEHAEAVNLRSAQDRQARIDVVRTLAELAAEIEELSAENAGTTALVERVRALVWTQALEPVGKTGEKVPFEPGCHRPIVGSPEEGSAVTVIRPGYRWRPAGEDVLLDKAVVTIE